MSGKKKISELSQVDISNANDLFEICTSNNLSKSITSKTLGEGILGSFTYSNSVSPNENIFTILSNLVLNSASVYNNQTTYNVGHLCTYQSKLYKCIVAITSPEDFNISHWLRTSVSEVVNQVSNRISAVSDRIDSSLSDLADEYDSTSTYIKGDYVIYNDKLYMANQDISVPEDFDDTKWLVTNVTDNLVNEYELPIATNSLLGGVKVGDGLLIDSTGVLSTDEIDLSVVENMIAEDFDSTKSYVVGDYCIYDNKLYKCIADITPAYWYKIPKEFSNDLKFTNVSANPEDCYVSITSNGHWVVASTSQNQIIRFYLFGSNNDLTLNYVYNGTESTGYYNGYDYSSPSIIAQYFPNGGYASENAALADLFSRPYFDSSNWTEVTVGDELKSIKEDIPIYTAGTNIEIDSDNKINCTLQAGNGIEIVDGGIITNYTYPSTLTKIGEDANGSYYQIKYHFDNVTSASPVTQALPNIPNLKMAHVTWMSAQLSNSFIQVYQSDVITTEITNGNLVITVLDTNSYTIDVMLEFFVTSPFMKVNFTTDYPYHTGSDASDDWHPTTADGSEIHCQIYGMWAASGNCFARFFTERTDVYACFVKNANVSTNHNIMLLTKGDSVAVNLRAFQINLYRGHIYSYNVNTAYSTKGHYVNTGVIYAGANSWSETDHLFDNESDALNAFFN